MQKCNNTAHCAACCPVLAQQPVTQPVLHQHALQEDLQLFPVLYATATNPLHYSAHCTWYSGISPQTENRFKCSWERRRTCPQTAGPNDKLPTSSISLLNADTLCAYTALGRKPPSSTTTITAEWEQTFGCRPVRKWCSANVIRTTQKSYL